MATPSIVVDPKIWREIAGPFVQFPTLNARVYYLTQGHCEEATIPPTINNLSPLMLKKSSIPCIIKSLQYLADPITDEIFAKLILQPVPLHPIVPPPPFFRGLDDPISYAKIITNDDHYRLGGFLISKELANSMFPPLEPREYTPTLDPPVLFRSYGQRLTITDIQGIPWEFEHIYKLSNNVHFIFFHRHFSLGCFSVAKNLVPGDTLVFVLNPRTRKLSLGIRRHKKGKVTTDSVVQALELAVNGRQFEVVYYPNPSVGWVDFVVRAEVFQQRTSIEWSIGMRVWFPVETGSLCNRITTYNGTVNFVLIPPEDGPWPNSPWRMLRITWDEQMPWNFLYVCPWQVNPIIPIT